MSLHVKQMPKQFGPSITDSYCSRFLALVSYDRKTLMKSKRILHSIVFTAQGIRSD